MRTHKSLLKRWKPKLDKEFSLLVRSLGYCEYCKKTNVSLHCAHIISRSNITLRWDIFNALCLCNGCHTFGWHKNPLIYIDWFKSKYPERYEYLLRVKNLILKRKEEDLQKIFEAIQARNFEGLILPKTLLDTLHEVS